jgi:hypothetical protein
LCAAGAEVAQDFDLLHLELGDGQSVWCKSGTELELTHRYIAGVVYMNDSVIGTALAGSSARARVTQKATQVEAKVLKNFIL